ncbi:integrase catalytic domain-containing protein [Trichonephila inaurata madagascariensis]|uniref:Integrase catalytic domain-containing protein n=1 Tax=Trichonephila inaurata madagascariensis TaxID=2747483 RepID=A0A8X6YZ59_9ARAC|nr:integrase catalytic domain-containing protein [Trichonephila inaurata madagascariensis]
MRNDTRDFLYPTILPSRHPVVEKIIRNRHEKLNHAGIQIVMCNLREFWILKYRKTVRNVIITCVRCRRFNLRPKPIVEAPFSEDRVKEAAVFEVVGIDYADPLILKDSKKA